MVVNFITLLIDKVVYMKKGEFILLISVILLGVVLVIGFIRDGNESLIERTSGLAIEEPQKVVEINKRGFLLYRSGYDAKIKIDFENDPDAFAIALTETYESGEVMSYEEFMAFKEDVFDGMEIVPNPTSGTNVFVLGAGEEYGENIVYVIDCENDTEAYLYIYYNR